MSRSKRMTQKEAGFINGLQRAENIIRAAAEEKEFNKKRT